MKKSLISFLLTPEEFKLLHSIVYLEPAIDEALAKAKAEDGCLRIKLNSDDLEDCLGALVYESNHTTSASKQGRLDALCDKLKGYARLHEHVRQYGRTVVKKKPSAKGSVYVFDARMLQYPPEGHDVIRTIAVSGRKSLYHLAEVIIDSFGFMFDHCFAFYGDVNAHPTSKQKEIYELFVDIGEEPTAPYAKGVEKVRIESVFQSPGKKMLLRFDYGDDWRFSVELKDIRPVKEGETLPSVLKKIGKAPMQYPPAKDF